MQAAGGGPRGPGPRVQGAAVSDDLRQKYCFMPRKVNYASFTHFCLLLLPPSSLLLLLYLFIFGAVSQISLLGDSGINSINARLMKQNVIFPPESGLTQGPLRCR